MYDLNLYHDVFTVKWFVPHTYMCCVPVISSAGCLKKKNVVFYIPRRIAVNNCHLYLDKLLSVSAVCVLGIAGDCT